MSVDNAGDFVRRLLKQCVKCFAVEGERCPDDGAEDGEVHNGLWMEHQVKPGVSSGALLRAIWPLARGGCGPWHGRFSKVCVEEMPWHGWAHGCGFAGEECCGTARADQIIITSSKRESKNTITYII